MGGNTVTQKWSCFQVKKKKTTTPKHSENKNKFTYKAGEYSNTIYFELSRFFLAYQQIKINIVLSEPKYIVLFSGLLLWPA